MEFPTYFRNTKTPYPQSNTPTLISETRSLKTLARKIPSQRWEFRFSGHTLNYDCVTGRNETLAFAAEFTSLAQGGFGIFDYRPNDVFLMASGLDITVTTDVTKGDDVIEIGSPADGADPTNSILPGKLMRFSTADKVYMITAVANLGIVNGFRRYRVNLNTGAFQDQAFGVRIIADRTMRIKLRLDGDIIEGSTPNINFNKTVYSFKMIEVI